MSTAHRTPKDGEFTYVLVADDVEDNRVLIEVYLTGRAYRLSFANTGDQTIELCRRQLFDVVLLDLNMPPGMDGYETARAIRKFEGESGRPRASIVALSAYGINEEREKLTSSGFDDYLEKGFTREKLLDVVDHWVRERRKTSVRASAAEPQGQLPSAAAANSLSRKA